MRVELTQDGSRQIVEVDLPGGTVELGGRRLRFRIVRETADGVELEIEGERCLVAGWPAGLPEPLPGLARNGERLDGRMTGRSESPGAAPTPDDRGTAPRPPSAVEVGAEGPPVVPPMPGKVLEVRVQEGETVAAGQLLLVIEAMKMRNEILAPVAGIVRGLAVAPGANVAARVVMLRITPT